MNISRFIYALPPFFRRHKVVRLLLWLFPGSRVQLVRFNEGAELYADLSDCFSRDYFLNASYDPEFFKIAGFFLRNGKVFFDIGANHGFCSFGLMNVLSAGQIEYHLFEANREIIPLLERSASLRPSVKIKINQVCVTDKPGVSRLFTQKGSLEISYISEKGSQQADNLILDDYISRQNISKIDFMKIDVEGHELQVLKGARKSLEKGAVKVIYMEASWANWERNDRPLSDCFDLLKETGFSLFYVKDVDFQTCSKDGVFSIRTQNETLRLRPLKDFPEGHQTDILAVHKTSEFYPGDGKK